MAPEDWMREEIRRLRDWKHDDAEPALATITLLQKALESLAGSQAALERRLVAVEEKVAQIANADQVTAAVRHAIWSAALTVGAFIVGAATVAGVIISYLH